MSDAKCIGNEIKAIHFEDADLLVRGFLGDFDNDHDKILDEFEINEAGGLDWIMKQLKSYALAPTKGIATNCGEYDLVATLGSEPVIPATIAAAKKVSGSNKTPNGREYPGVINDIPGGDFEMGSVHDEKVHDCDEHKSNGQTLKVHMTGFRLAKTEVTVGQYKAYLREIVDTNDLRLPAIEEWLPNFKENKKGDNFPVVGLEYKDMVGFAQYYGGKLPTAAQIEYASKGPSHTDVYGTPRDKAILWENGNRTTAEVCGVKDERSNGWACDLAGNVWEATSDQYAYSYDNMSTTDPANQFTAGLFGGRFEVRGGSFSNDPGHAPAADRYYGYPDDHDYFGGFRVAWPQ